MRDRQPCVYIMASGQLGTLYVGVTSDLEQRVLQHKYGVVKGFSKKYGTTFLVHYELYDTMLDAIEREKELKKYRRQWKVRLIEEANSEWRDLAEKW